MNCARNPGLQLIALLLLGALAQGDDWPTFGHDNRRSHVTNERLTAKLAPLWKHAGPRPQMAWAGPAKWDAYASRKNLASMRSFDPAFFVIAVGNRLWFGSSVDDSVHCLDAATGRPLWTTTTGGPVRVAPTWHDGKIYAGSDDGKAYCLDAVTGKEKWSRSPAEKEQWLISNGKLISTWPCRTGVLVQNGLAYCGMSLLPWETSFLCAFDATTGRPSASGGFLEKHASFTMQGPLTASADRLFISQGRQEPVVCELRTGKSLGKVGKGGDGGIWGLVTPEGVFIHGRGQNHGSDGELREFDAKTRQRLLHFPKARRLAIAGGMVFLLGDGKLRAFDWGRSLPLSRQYGSTAAKRRSAEAKLKKLGKNGKKEVIAALRTEIGELGKLQETLQKQVAACELWSVPTDCAHDLMVTADLVFAGGDRKVTAFDRKTGSNQWAAEVDGKAYGLAAAGGRLFVSTDSGSIHAFSAP
ncbi:MAG: PQQ-binding-like beta-propeller repeat protein [Victivallales bacterium]|jgi:outer membrane protein assembly factor BamB|nr:PQQ-binding-like beta-propeller repeat protein [Victivallales bacterium]MBT7166722.1 PQQ-binding-like beta-propeller repeat protein [Victivallales bacterium]